MSGPPVPPVSLRGHVILIDVQLRYFSDLRRIEAHISPQNICVKILNHSERIDSSS